MGANRIFVSALALPAFLLAAAPARADTIHLKNGHTIVADSVRENGERVEYELGDNTYAISKSSVDRIEAGGAAAPVPSAADAAVVPLAPAATQKDLEKSVPSLFENGQVRPGALEAIEATHDDQLIAQAYFAVGMHEQGAGNIASARLAFDNALAHADGFGEMDDVIQVLLNNHLNNEAVRFAETYVHKFPDSATAYKWLGYAYFLSDRKADAAKALSHSLQLHADADVAMVLDRASRESTAETGFLEQGSNHFSLKFEGNATPEQLQKLILDTLERHYDDLVRDLGVAPRERIQVVLYTKQAYFDVTQAPSWSGAVYDGKLRIPVSGLTSVTPELNRVLKHELTHSFVNQIAKGRCPHWLNEGLAMIEEPHSLGALGPIVAQLFQSGRDLPLNQLEGSFMGLSTPQATLAYAESFAAADYIRQHYGVLEIARIMQSVGDGQSLEATMRQRIHMGYADLETAVGSSLSRQYGL